MTDIPTFPLQHLPAFWSGWVESTSRRLGAPSDYVAAGLFASLAAVADGRVAAEPMRGWREPLHLWLGLIGSPRTGKSRALDTAAALCGDGVRPVRPEGLASWLARSRHRSTPHIAGELQPHTLAAALADDSVAGRFLYFWPERPGWRSLLARGTEADPDEPACLARIAALATDPADPLMLPFNPEALALFDSFCARNYEEIGDGEGDPRVIAWLSGAPARVARLALAVVLLDWCAGDASARPTALGPAAVTRAIALHDSYFLPQAMRVLARCGETRRVAPVERVLRWLAETGAETVSREEIRIRALAQTVDAARTAEIVADLETRGVLVRLARPEGKAGRPSDRWEVRREAVGYSDIRKPAEGARRAGQPIVFEMPEIKSAADLRPALTALARQAAEGKLSIAECQKMTTVVKTHKDIIDLEELTNRLTKIEKAVEHDRRVYAALPKPRTAGGLPPGVPRR